MHGKVDCSASTGGIHIQRLLQHKVATDGSHTNGHKILIINRSPILMTPGQGAGALTVALPYLALLLTRYLNVDHQWSEIMT